MAPLPHNSTDLYYLDYHTVGTDHTLEMRFGAALSPAAFGTLMDSVLDILGAGHLYSWQVLGVRFQAEGSDISTPVTTGIEGNIYGSGAGDPNAVPQFLSFQGRGLSGRRVNMKFFGYTGELSRYRLTYDEASWVQDCIILFNANVNAFWTIGGDKAILKPYANIGLNSYWQRKVRTG